MLHILDSCFQISRGDVCDGTTINIEITVNSDGAPFSDTVEYMGSGQVYPTNIYLPVGSNFTAEICAVTPVGRGQCIMYKSGIASPPPTATTGMYVIGSTLLISVTILVLLSLQEAHLMEKKLVLVWA